MRGRSRVTVRPVSPSDAEAWVRMRTELWPDGSAGEHGREIAAFFAGAAAEPAAVFVAIEDRAALGFVELSIRATAEGCRTNRIAYVEGWYVAPAARRTGVGRALIGAAEEWGRAQGCEELASDTEIANETSARAHLALGFEDAGVIRCYRKDLAEGGVAR